MLRDGVEVEGAALTLPAATDRLRFDFAMPLDGAVPTMKPSGAPHARCSPREHRGLSTGSRAC